MSDPIQEDEHQTEKPAEDGADTPEARKRAFLAMGIGAGVAIGAGLGVAMGNLAVGIGVGVAIGTALGVSLGNTRNKA